MTSYLNARTQGDTAYPPTFTCKADDEPVDLLSATVLLTATDGDRSIVLDHALVGTGEVQPQGDTWADELGEWSIRIKVTFVGGKKATFPGPGQAAIIMPIVEDETT